MPEYWIQIENRPWDACPHNIDRMTGQTLKDLEGKDPLTVTLTSPGTGVVRNNVTMFRPLLKGDGTVDDALILRRYQPPQKPDLSDAWTVPDDRKVNPWDVNEPDPTDSGTMGTIPGPVIECNVGESVTVHFRNLDNRTQLGTQTICFPFPFIGQICLPFPAAVPLPVEQRTHSLHPHGFVFAPTSDGAYPLTPPDPAQPVPAAEAAAWASVGVTGQFKQGDRVPPGGTFTYTWNTLGWPTTAGVWLYHDHSICDEENVSHGAIGIIVIHNQQDPEEVLNQDLPPLGSPIQVRCFPLPFDVPILPHQLATIGSASLHPDEDPAGGGMNMSTPSRAMAMNVEKRHKEKDHKAHKEHEDKHDAPRLNLLTRQGDFFLEADKELLFFRRICRFFYAAPPTQALYLQLFHTLGDAGMCINGRKYLGNTPTMIAGPRTKMRFGVVGMGSEAHTFHIHGHRWIVPGPDGTVLIPDIQGSVQKRPVSQFEDTRIFGPANSFVFTIHEDAGQGSFMRAEPAIGEWHMHCHVLDHMMTGMMGSLLVIQGGETVTQLPRGKPCPSMGGMQQGGGGGGAQPKVVTLKNIQFNPKTLNVNAGDTVEWQWQEDNNSTTSDTNIWDSGVRNNGATFQHTFNSPGSFAYHCSIHGGTGGLGMSGTIVVT